MAALRQRMCDGLNGLFGLTYPSLQRLLGLAHEFGGAGFQVLDEPLLDAALGVHGGHVEVDAGWILETLHQPALLLHQVGQRERVDLLGGEGHDAGLGPAEDTEAGNALDPE